MASAELNV